MTKSVCALGFFDGVHEAHIGILKSCVSYAEEHNLKSVAMTFEKSPAEFFGKKIKYLTSLEKKTEIMKSLGIDEVIILPCDENILSLTPKEFIDTIIVDKLNAKALFCGFNYTFGKGAKGDSALLKELCSKIGIEVFVKERMTDFGVTVSSSEIRSALSKGDIDKANNLLTRPFEITGTVSEGKRLGRQLNFPTANIYPDNLPDLPFGVYATKTVVENKEYLSVTNVGVNPTVKDDFLRVETYIIDFDNDIYNKNIAIKFYKFLRKEQNFSSVDELKAQIEKDAEGVVAYFKESH